jgi:hypothetical protein
VIIVLSHPREREKEMPMATRTMPSVLAALIESLRSGNFDQLRPHLAPETVFDATVPGWRFLLRGPESIVRQLHHWWPTPAELPFSRVTPTTEGAVVEFERRWLGDGGLRGCRQVHILVLDGERVREMRVTCAGEWDEETLRDVDCNLRDCRP